MAEHPDWAYVEGGVRNLTIEARVCRKGGTVVFVDPDGPQVVQINLSPEGLDFLIGHLPEQDRFTKDLVYAKRLAKDALWHRNGGVA